MHLEDAEGGGAGALVLFVAVSPMGDTSTDLIDPIKRALRSNLSPRHVPDEIHALPSIPTTLSGKKLELPVKKILRGADPDAVASRGALEEPRIPRRRRPVAQSR